MLGDMYKYIPRLHEKEYPTAGTTGCAGWGRGGWLITIALAIRNKKGQRGKEEMAIANGIRSEAATRADKISSE